MKTQTSDTALVLWSLVLCITALFGFLLAGVIVGFLRYDKSDKAVTVEVVRYVTATDSASPTSSALPVSSVH